MKSTIKHGTGLGRRPARKKRRIARPFAARKATGTRRDERADRKAERLRRRYLVTNGEDLRDWHGPTRFEIGDGVPISSGLPRDTTTADVVADVVRRFDMPSVDDAVIDDEEGDEEDGFAGADVAIWRDGKLLAVVRRGADVEPEAIIFDSFDATERGVMTSPRPPGRRGPEASDPIRARLRELKRQIGAIDRRHDERSGA